MPPLTPADGEDTDHRYVESYIVKVGNNLPSVRSIIFPISRGPGSLTLLQYYTINIHGQKYLG
jgi:hypothetical protein